MEITEIRVTLRDEERLKGFANMTFDNAFVVRGMKIIQGNTGYFIAMPSRKRPDGTYQDIAHPVNSRHAARDRRTDMESYEHGSQSAQRQTFKIIKPPRQLIGASSSGKTPAFGAGIPRFESWRPSQICRGNATVRKPASRPCRLPRNRFNFHRGAWTTRVWQ